MRLPSGDRAIVDIAKLHDYCLNPLHPRGRHKARVFRSALGITQADVGFLREELLRAASEADVTVGDFDEYGERYAIDFGFALNVRRAIIRSTWIVLRGERFPRLTSCFVL